MSPDVQAALAAMFANGSDPSIAAAMASKFAADASVSAAASVSRRPPPMPFDILTLGQAAEYLQLPEDAVRSEAAAGRLTGRCVGGEWRFVREEIISWLRTPQKSLRSLLNVPPSDETDEEFEKFQESIRAYRDEVDRATGSGKYATE